MSKSNSILSIRQLFEGVWRFEMVLRCFWFRRLGSRIWGIRGLLGSLWLSCTRSTGREVLLNVFYWRSLLFGIVDVVVWIVFCVLFVAHFWFVLSCTISGPFLFIIFFLALSEILLTDSDFNEPVLVVALFKPFVGDLDKNFDQKLTFFPSLDYTEEVATFFEFGSDPVNFFGQKTYILRRHLHPHFIDFCIIEFIEPFQLLFYLFFWQFAARFLFLGRGLHVGMFFIMGVGTRGGRWRGFWVLRVGVIDPFLYNWRLYFFWKGFKSLCLTGWNLYSKESTFTRVLLNRLNGRNMINT